MIIRLRNFRLKLFSIFLLPFVFNSCFNTELTEQEIIEGNWLIEEIIEGDTDVTRETLMQAIYFKPDRTCRFPFLDNSGLKWEYYSGLENERKLILTREQSVFKQEYDLIFKIDERNLLQIELISERQIILLTKLLFYPKDHPDFIKELLN